ncbi:IclR family transcriptional regulator [Oscillibacter sp.]|uniref:IclR family transcriptional regulator n=1 Tax=Oscillibacter sp. TaxID=1945593 RepID=UPI002D80266C|nr:IclR family transcriptional regulator [Oscillibacter sp.]
MENVRGFKNIQSVERAVSILDYLSHSPSGAHLTAISKDLGLNKSTAFGLISTLENLRCVRQDQNTSRYHLGLRLLEFGRALMSSMDIISVAKPFLRELAGKYDETVNLALLSGDDVIYVDKVQSSKSVRVEMQLHEQVPTYCCSTGKVFLSYMEEGRRNKIIEKTDFKSRTIYTISSKAQLLAELENIRSRGYAYDREEYEIGLTCLAAPVLDAEKNVSAAISLNAPTGRMIQINQDELIRDITSIADQLAKQLEELGV